MHRGIAEQQLRGADEFTVDAHLGALAGKPLAMIAPGNVADLFAMAEKDDLPRGMVVKLRGYQERIGRAIADLPNGPEFLQFVETLGAIEPSRVPASLRDLLAAEGERGTRGAAEKAAVTAQVESWTDTEPEAFAFGAGSVAMKKAPESKRREEKKSTMRPAGMTGTREPGEKKPRAKKARAPKKVVPVDQARVDWIQQTVLERLAGRTGDGLQQAVLIAGLKHRAREAYPDLQPKEIVDQLNALEKDGRVRRTALRWSLPGARY